MHTGTSSNHLCIHCHDDDMYEHAKKTVPQIKSHTHRDHAHLPITNQKNQPLFLHIELCCYLELSSNYACICPRCETINVIQIDGMQQSAWLLIRDPAVGLCALVQRTSCGSAAAPSSYEILTRNPFVSHQCG